MRTLLLLALLVIITGCSTSAGTERPLLGGVWIGNVHITATFDEDGHVESGTFRDFWTVEQRPSGAVVYCLFWCFLGDLSTSYAVFSNGDLPVRLPAMVPNHFQQITYDGWADEAGAEIHMDVHDYDILADGVEEKLPGFTLDLIVDNEKRWDYSRTIHDF